MKKLVRIVCLSGMLLSAIAFAGRSQSEKGCRFQVELDYHYFFGLSQKVGQYGTFHRSDAKMYGNALRLSGMYAFTPRLSAGAGIGTANYVHAGFDAIPVFAAFRYAPLRASLQPYVFTNLGYAIGASTTEKGVMWDLGVGYKRMFRKHFGMKFELGYNLQQVKLDQDNIIVFPDEDGHYPSISPFSMFRHSISAGFGFIF